MDHPHEQHHRHNMAEGRPYNSGQQLYSNSQERVPSVTVASGGQPMVTTTGPHTPHSTTYAPDHRDSAHRPLSPAHGQKTAADLVRQKDNEIHLLRMTVTDKDVQLGRFTRDLDHCHHQIKHLNTLLTEKKENILGYQEQIAGMKAELAQLRDVAMSGGQRGAQESTQAERALQMQVEQMSRQNSDLHRQLEEERRRGVVSPPDGRGQQWQREEQWRQGGPPPQDGRGRAYRATGGDQSELENLHIQRDQARMELDTVRQQSRDLKTRVEMLEVQVSIYKEDFQSERADRERAQAELHTLKEEGDSLRQAINMLATEHGIRLGPTGLPLPPNNN